eukprot:403342388
MSRNRSINESQNVEQINDLKDYAEIQNLLNNRENLDSKVKGAQKGYARAVSQGNVFMQKQFKQNAELFNIRQTNYAYYYSTQKQQIYELKNRSLLQSPLSKLSTFNHQTSEFDNNAQMTLKNQNQYRNAKNIFQQSLMNTQIEDQQDQNMRQANNQEENFVFNSINLLDRGQSQDKNQIRQIQVQNSDDLYEQDNQEELLNFIPKSTKVKRTVIKRTPQQSLLKVNSQEKNQISQRVSFSQSQINQSHISQDQNQSQNALKQTKRIENAQRSRQSILLDDRQLKIILFNHLKDDKNLNSQVTLSTFNQNENIKATLNSYDTNSDTFSAQNESVSLLKYKAQSIVDQRRSNTLYSRQLSPIDQQSKLSKNINSRAFSPPIQNSEAEQGIIKSSQLGQSPQYFKASYQPPYNLQQQTNPIKYSKTLHTIEFDQLPQFSKAVGLKNIDPNNAAYPTSNKKHRDMNDERHEFYEFLKRKWQTKHDLYKYDEYKTQQTIK